MGIFSTFEKIGKDKTLVVTALALERMWMPCMEGVQKTDFLDEEDRSQYIQIMEEGMQMVWGRIKRGHALLGDEARLKELNCIIMDILDPEEIEIEGAGAVYCLWDGLLYCAKSFFVDEVFDRGGCTDAIDNVFHMVDNALEIFLYYNLYESSSDIAQKNKELTSYIIGNHPVRIAEVNCPDIDIELAQNYPHNMDEIMKKREEYHNRNIIDFKPLEEYGFHVKPVR